MDAATFHAGADGTLIESAVAAGDLPAHKARILLGLALTVTEDAAAIRELFLGC